MIPVPAIVIFSTVATFSRCESNESSATRLLYKLQCPKTSDAATIKQLKAEFPWYIQYVLAAGVNLEILENCVEALLVLFYTAVAKVALTQPSSAAVERGFLNRSINDTQNHAPQDLVETFVMTLFNDYEV